MATLNQGAPGLQGWADTPPTKTPKPKQEMSLEERHCRACGCRVPHVIETRSRKVKLMFFEDDGLCRACGEFFGYGALMGCTNKAPEEALANIRKLKQLGFLMLLKDRSLAAQDGNILNLGAGDIFQCSPSNPEPDPAERPSKALTWGIFMLPVQIGPYETRLFPHEWSPISLKTVMDLKSAGEVMEAFISGTDKVGHFTPSPELRRQIEETFGRLIT